MKSCYTKALRSCKFKDVIHLQAGLFLLLATATFVVAQQPTKPAATTTSTSAPKMMPMPSVAPLFLEGAGFTSTLFMVNETTGAFQAQVDVYSINGTRVSGKAVTVAANGMQSVNIRDLLNASSAAIDMGSIRISSTPSTDGLLSALAVTHNGKIETYFDEEVPMPTMEGSNVLRGVADGAGANSVVAISSLASAVQHVTVSCLMEHGIPTTRVLEVLPNQTLMTSPCSREQSGLMLSASDITGTTARLADDDDKPSGAAGISITTDGMPGELAAYGIVPHAGKGTPYFTALNFTDPKMKRSNGAVYVGVPVGPSSLLAQGHYQPEMAVANFGPTPASVTLQSAVTASGSPASQTLATLSLASGEVKTLHLINMRASPDLRASVLVETNANPGDLITKLLSRQESGPRTVEILDKESSNGANSGGHPWTTAPGITSTLLLFNHDPAAQWFNVRFGNPSGKGPWMKRYKLASMETLAISINDLIANEDKDDNGNKLSISQQSGEVGWQSDTASAAGRMLQASPAVGIARNFSCSNYNTVCNVSMYPSILELGFDQTLTFSGGFSFNLNHFYPSQSCSCNNQTYSQYTTSEYWSTGNPSIATITSGGSSTSSSWFGVAPGSTTGTFTVDGPYNLDCQTQEPVITVPIIDHVYVSSDSGGSCTGCTAAVLRSVTYQFRDLNNAAISNAFVCETGNLSAPTTQPNRTNFSCKSPSTLPPLQWTQCTTPQSDPGFLIDQWGFTSGSSSFSPNPCGYNTTDWWVQYLPYNSPQFEAFLYLYGSVLSNGITIDGNSTSLIGEYIDTKGQPSYVWP